MPSSNHLWWPFLAAALAALPAGAETVATVNGEAIDSSLLDAYTEARALQGGGGSDYLDELVTQELLVQEAEKANLADDPKVAQRLKLQRRGVLARAAIDAYMEQHPVDEEAVRGRYQAMADEMEGAKEYKARHILVATEDEAQTVIGQLDEGADFAELARSKSTGPSGPEGGDLGWSQSDRLVPPFAEAVAEMEVGSYSSDPVQTQFGWHVILLEDTRDAAAPPFEAVQQQLEQQMLESRIQDYLESLRAGAEIERP